MWIFVFFLVLFMLLFPLCRMVH